MSHSIVYGGRVVGVHETEKGRVTIDIYCPDGNFPEQRFFPAVLDTGNPKQDRHYLQIIEALEPDKPVDFIVEDFSGVSSKNGRPFRICKFQGFLRETEVVG